MVLKCCETTVSTCTFKSSIILLESQSTYCSTHKVFESEWKKKSLNIEGTLHRPTCVQYWAF